MSGHEGASEHGAAGGGAAARGQSGEVDAVFSRDAAGGVVLAVHAQPGASRSEVVGRHGRAVKVRVAAPPEGGKANAALTALLATELGLRRGQVEVVSGRSGRAKRVRLEVGPAVLSRWLEQFDAD